MYFITLCKLILRDMWAWKMRSFLALFGIIWGTITVVLLLALGTGYSRASQKNLGGLVDGTFFVVPAKTSVGFRGFPAGQAIHIKASDVIALPRVVPHIKMVTPMLIGRTKIHYKSNFLTKEVYGVGKNFAELQKVSLASGGRFFNYFDLHKRRYVAVLGNKIKLQLFGNTPALGKNIIINGINFSVIGVTQKPVGRHAYDFYKNKVVLPYSTYINMFGNTDSYFFIVFPDPNYDSQTIQQNMRSYLAYKRHFSPSDSVALRVIDTTQIFQFLRWFFIGIQIFLGICGVLTLGVGSLGVANIMFLIVTERTREIGIRMAMGAKTWNILLQIMLEALILIIIGGLVGFLLSYFTIGVLQTIGLPQWLGVPEISAVSVIVTIVILALLGLVAGFFPARRAANMDPVEALGY